MPNLHPDRPVASARPQPRLGTFLGVFIPTILTILGVIMYLRFGWVVGHAGIGGALLIVCLANSITLLTSLSLSAIATNGRVGIGGAYFIISRSLGIEIGGAIGVPLFLSQTLSVTLYAYGLAESLRIVWAGVPVSTAAFFIILAVGLLSLRGTGSALRAQIPILGLIVLSVVALLAGVVVGADWSRVSHASSSGDVEFWQVFAVFFPAVTGVMAGLGLSGDLADPRRSIPRGTLSAVLAGFAVYMIVPFALVLGADADVLRDDPLVWTRIAPLGAWLIIPGLWGAIFSSAVGSVLGAPRTLQAMALDRLAPRWMAHVSPGGSEPVAGLAVTLMIALGAVFLGDLNAVAEVVSMFFLTVYGTLNMVAALERVSGDPSWRPQLSVHWSLSLLGGFAGLGVMLLINPIASVIAVAAELALFLVFQRREHRANWGDARRGLFEALIRWAMVRLARLPMSARNWRPHILLFLERVEDSLELVRFATWFSQDRGIVTVCEMLKENETSGSMDPFEREQEIDALLREEGLVAFGEVDVVESVEKGLFAVAQANGMAGIASNTLMLGFPSHAERLGAWLRIARRLEPLHKSLILARASEPCPRQAEPEVHVWWGGLDRNGDLMLLLAYLLTRNPEWRQAKIKILSMASNEMMKQTTEQNLRNLLPEIRIEAEVEATLRPKQGSIAELIRARSRDADVVFIGLASPEPGAEIKYAERLLEISQDLDNVFFVRNGTLFVGELITPEGEGAQD